MADAGVDIAQLTEDQQLALQQFTAVTDQDINQAVPLLQRCQWNVQVRILIRKSSANVLIYRR